MLPNRMGLGLRPPLPSYGQGPSMSALAQQAMQNQHFAPPPAQKTVSLFVGSISGGVTDSFLNDLLAVSAWFVDWRDGLLTYIQACGTVKSFKRLITPANKPQGFGFAEFEDPDGALRAIALLNGVELPALEDGCANKKLLVRLAYLSWCRFTPTSGFDFLGQSRREDKGLFGRDQLTKDGYQCMYSLFICLWVLRC